MAETADKACLDRGTVPLLEVQDLELTFHSDFGDHSYLQGVSFKIYPGEVVGLVGESGSGKSITSLAIMGLLAKNGRVSGGRILFKGQDLTQMSESDLDTIRGRHISMVFQDALTSLNPVFTIGNQLREAIRAHRPLSRREANQEAIDLLTRVGLPRAKSVMRQYPHALSGGMRQRVMIAMAIAGEPELMIADEPTTALDVTVQAQIMALIKSLAQERGTAILIISHDIGLLAQMADRILVMYAGQLVEESELHQLFEDPGHPYTAALLRSVPSITDSSDRQLHSIPGVVPADYAGLEGCRFYDRCSFARESCRVNRQDMTTLPSGQRVRCERAAQGDFSNLAWLGKELVDPAGNTARRCD
ncbi:MAG: ABC transporter ATP-binding protein [Eubacteriales bacterium]|nr:ABC transporter ATP-binding protein [Clostridiales bacterium]MDY5835727.1 ABC transporter ATP-binding protein [Eubacteriales bacterium]